MTPRRFTDQQEAEIAAAYLAGESAPSLARRYGTNKVTIGAAVKRQGHTTRGHRWSKLRFPEVADEVLRRYEAGESQAAIARGVGVEAQSISKFLRARGVARPRLQNREGHGHWKGGVISINGYRAVLVNSDDPMFSMAHNNGYALEHRLVMARHLGRLLTADETVHHINGDKTDNRIENLQLRRGRHGKHAAYQCADCGSRNVVATTLL